jgi:hypothetical protein
VGEEGENNEKKLVWGPMEEAIKAFEKKFKEKTKNAWGGKGMSFIKHAGLYQLVEVEDDDADGDAGYCMHVCV